MSLMVLRLFFFFLKKKNSVNLSFQQGLFFFLKKSYKQQKFIAHSLEGGKSKIKAPAWLHS